MRSLTVWEWYIGDYNVNIVTSLTILSLHLLHLVHIRVVLLPVRCRRVVHVSRARHGGLSPTTLWYFLNKYSTVRTSCMHTAYSHLWRSITALHIPLTPGDCSLCTCWISVEQISTNFSHRLGCPACSGFYFSSTLRW